MFARQSNIAFDGYSGKRGSFPNPFDTYAKQVMPTNLSDVFRYCDHLWLNNGTYRMACQRVVRYFLTRIELEDISDDEKKKYDEFLTKTFRIMEKLALVGDDLMASGNSIVSMYIPFRRYLKCANKSCGVERPISEVDYEFKNFDFIVTCEQCGCRGSQLGPGGKPIDRRSPEAKKIDLIRWPLREIRMLYHPLSHQTEYIWEIPSDFKRNIQQGIPFIVETTPWEIMEAVKVNQRFRFAPGVIYHLKEETLAGVRNYGWGIPRALANFEQGFYMQTLRRLNEAVSTDYSIPFRVITPKARAGTAGDPLLHVDAGGFMGKVRAMVRNHRQDPAQYLTLPFPIDYVAHGGEAKMLAPVELLQNATADYLDASGVPNELYRGNLQVQAAPLALRLFEKTWTHYISAMDGLIQWILDSLSDLLNWEKAQGRMQPTTLADNLEKKQLQLQLAAGNMISKQTAYAPFGLDYREEIRRALQEEKFMQEEQARMAKEQQQAQELQMQFDMASTAQPQQAGMDPMAAMGGGAPGVPPPGGGMPAGGGGMAMGGGAPAGGSTAGVTPDDMMGQAEELAYQLLGMPYELRRSQLSQIKNSNETLHALVIAKIGQMRQQAQTQGGYQMLQQMTGGQG